MAPSVGSILVGDVLPRVLTIAVAIAGGVTFANLLVAFGVIDYIATLSRPLTGPANLPDEVGGAIITTAASTTAGYGMLAEYRDSGLLDDRATLVAVTINTFFGFVQHIFTFYAPVLIPILGLRVGLLYVGARAGVALAITLTGVALGALLLSAKNVDPEAMAGGEGDGEAPPDARADGGESDDSENGPPETTRGKLREAGRSGIEKTWDILPRLVVVYTLVVLLTTYYDLEALTGGAADPLATLTGLPSAAVPVIVVYAFDTTSGAVTIAPLIEDGVFTARTAVATMLLGGIVSFTVSTFKRSVPFQFGIWGTEFGTKVVVVNTTLKVVWIAVALALLLAV
ncbi:nucleoside recognition protein [Natronomonas gomsonensis]|uniref:nucleoside recognition protein n=1 Tax=Natronomonas gomsonensis TaxID=1046043 RepID=UPI0020CA4A73|nr:nucleoside recognition protein [Natronomonas gomsonensis]MCY4731379.1 nucleoside recognition protein [Natronomonas gomsonensis]